MNETRTCIDCEGTGLITKVVRLYYQDNMTTQTRCCHTCDGKGWIEDENIGN